MGKRLAILKVTRERIKREIRPENWLLIEHDLKLPGGAMITGISEHALFDEDLVAVRVECPDFREVQRGEKIPTVDMAFDDQGKFIWWIGVSVETAKLPGGYLIPKSGMNGWEWSDSEAAALRAAIRPATGRVIPTGSTAGTVQALAEFERLAGKSLSTVDGGGWSPAVSATEGTRTCTCPAADMLADGWRCTCGAKTE